MAAISIHFTKRVYPLVDAADKVRCRTDLAILIYPGHFSLHAAEWDTRQGRSKYVMPGSVLSACSDNELCLNPEVPVTSQTPPTFLLQNEDDHVDNVNDALAYYIDLKKAKRAGGDAPLCARRPCLWPSSYQAPVTAWPELVNTWLNTTGMTH